MHPEGIRTSPRQLTTGILLKRRWTSYFYHHNRAETALSKDEPMARIRKSKTNTTYFMDIPKCDENGKKWKKSEDDNSLEVAAD